MSPEPGFGRTCLLTGATGYLGSRIKKRLESEGWSVRALGRADYTLGAEPPPGLFAGADAFIHCAYDFSPVRWPDIRRINVGGAERLLRAAHDQGVARIVFISTISAYEGCKSYYGKGKLAVEATAREIGAWAIRPGLVYGDGDPGAAFGALVKNVRRSSLLPIPGDGSWTMVMAHEDDLTLAIARALDEGRPAPPVPVTVAHPQRWTFTAILHEIAKALGKRLTVVPTPWQLMWLGLATLETLGLRIGVRSDSLVSLVHQNPTPDINVEAALGVSCRPFAPKLAP